MFWPNPSFLVNPKFTGMFTLKSAYGFPVVKNHNSEAGSPLIYISFTFCNSIVFSAAYDTPQYMQNIPVMSIELFLNFKARRDY